MTSGLKGQRDRLVGMKRGHGQRLPAEEGRLETVMFLVSSFPPSAELGGHSRRGGEAQSRTEMTAVVTVTMVGR